MRKINQPVRWSFWDWWNGGGEGDTGSRG